MKRENLLRHEFVDHIPDPLCEGVVYISIKFRTVVHKCPCGCGSEVVTPLSPKSWRLAYDGEKVSLEPSIGNWNLPCQSHYWIRANKIVWAPTWFTHRFVSGVKRISSKNKGMA